MRRVFFTVLFVSLVLSALMGCSGPQFHGTLGGNNGTGPNPPNGIPTPSPGQPQVASINPIVATAGGASFTLTVTGLNFIPTTTVLWDGITPLTTTYVSSTVLQAQVPTSLIGHPDTVIIIPSPSGTFNFGTNFTITTAPLSGNSSFTVSKVPVEANDMVWSPTDSRLYLAVASGDASRPNSITSLDPQSGQFGSSLSTGSNPSRLAISSDGAYVYASLNDSFAVHRYTLPNLQSDINIPLGIGSYTGYYASELAVQPTNSHAIAVARSPIDVSYPDQGDVAIYDDSTPRTQTAASGTNLQINELLWNTDGQNLYGVNSTDTTVLYIMSADNTGVQIKAKPAVTVSLAGSLHFDSTTGYIYNDIGTILDSGTAAPIASFPVNALQSGFSSTPLMIPDSKLNIAYFLGRTMDGPGPSNYVIEAFDLTHFNLLGTASIPNVSGTPYKFVRWGSNGLAFLTRDPNGTGGSAGVYLISGAFVTSPAP